VRMRPCESEAGQQGREEENGDGSPRRSTVLDLDILHLISRLLVVSSYLLWRMTPRFHSAGPLDSSPGTTCVSPDDVWTGMGL